MTTKKQLEPKLKLSKIQKFYIAEHKDRDLKQLAVDVESPIGLVRAYIKTLEKTEAKKAAIADKPITIGNPNTGITKTRADDLMAKHHRGGVVVMTETASQMGDEFAKQNRTMPDRLAKNVQEIRPKRN
jgi:heterodisulfide reductase subunit A-like polyferredoxin